MSIIAGRDNFWKEPQFIFGVILLAAWLFFLYPPLSSVQTPSQGTDPLASAERISALFTTALGFVWGHYFGKAGAAEAAKAIVEPQVKEKVKEELNEKEELGAGIRT